jgi:hypothetical protein
MCHQDCAGHSHDPPGEDGHHSYSRIPEPVRKKQKVAHSDTDTAMTEPPPDTPLTTVSDSNEPADPFERDRKYVFFFREEQNEADRKDLLKKVKGKGFKAGLVPKRPEACLLLYSDRIILSTPNTEELEAMKDLLGEVVGPPESVTTSSELAHYRRACIEENKYLPQGFPDPKAEAAISRRSLLD